MVQVTVIFKLVDVEVISGLVGALGETPAKRNNHWHRRYVRVSINWPSVRHRKHDDSLEIV